MKKFKEVSQVRIGDFVYCQGNLSVISNVRKLDNKYLLDLENGATLVRKDSDEMPHLEFFRTIR